MRSWTVAIALIVSSVLAVWAYLWTTPHTMQRQMLRALARQPVWAVRAAGALDQGALSLDLLQREGGAQFVRISYPPLKLLNNQWIALERASSISLVSSLQLAKRLTTLKDLWHHQERFELAFSVPQLVQGAGVLWINRRTGLPQEATFTVAHNPQPSTVHLQFAYRDPTSGLPLSARPLAEVLIQLEEVAKAHNGKPKKLVPLEAVPRPRDADSNGIAFTHDFDHDGLSDALELFYGTDPVNPDTDNDMHLDGVEAESGYDPAGPGRLSE